MGKTMSPPFLDQILFILAGNDKIHESLDEFEIRPDPTAGFHDNRVMMGKTVSPLFLSYFSSVTFHTCGKDDIH